MKNGEELGDGRNEKNEKNEKNEHPHPPTLEGGGGGGGGGGEHYAPLVRLCPTHPDLVLPEVTRDVPDNALHVDPLA